MFRKAKRITNNEYNTCEYVQIPPTDIEETEHAFLLRAELPGVEKEGLSITVEDKKLEIHGTIAPKDEHENYVYREFLKDDFHRTFALSKGIDTKNINAELKNGLLTLTLTKKEETKPKKIPVTVH